MDLTFLPFLWFQLVVLALIIVLAATYLTKSADVIAFKTGLGRSFVGLVLLATATSLPELGTGLTSVISISGYDGVNLAAGDLFGSNIFNLLIIGLLAILWKDASIFKSVTKNVIPMGIFGILLGFISIVGILIHRNFTFMETFLISPISIILIGIFVFSMYYIYKNGHNPDSLVDEEPYTQDSLFRASVLYGISAFIVVVAAIFLVQTADSLSIKMNWVHGFVGTQFLAVCTSLPELAASIAAIRIMAPQLAITNLLGSNIFNMGVVLFMDDIFYLNAPIWEMFSYIHLLTALMTIIMTTIVLLPIVNNKSMVRFRIQPMILIFLYVITSLVVFIMV